MQTNNAVSVLAAGLKLSLPPVRADVRVKPKAEVPKTIHLTAPRIPQRQYITRHGIPCDHIPVRMNNKLFPTTGKWEYGHMYYHMHIGSFTNPQKTWIREDHFSVMPE